MMPGSSVASWLWKIASPIFLLVGTLGNVLCILVLTRPRTRESSTAMYLAALAFSDLIVLYSGLLRWWLIHLVGVDIRLLGDFGCKLDWYLIFASTELSSWLLVALTCERIISTAWPYKVRVFCTQKTALVTIAALTLIIYGGSSHLLYGTGIEGPYAGNASHIESGESDQSTGSLNLRSSVTFPPPIVSDGNSSVDAFTSEKRFCGAPMKDQEYHEFFTFVYPWMDLFLYFAIPAVILAVGEVLIVRKLVESRKMRLTMFTIRTTTAMKNSDKSSSIAMMLLTVNAVFILCTTPVCIYLIGMPYWVDANTGFTETQEILWTVVNLLMYLNHTINFILYFLSGARFRRNVQNFLTRNQTDLSLALRDANSSDGKMQMAEKQSPRTGSHLGDSDDSKPQINRKQSVNTIGTSVSEYYITDMGN